MSEQTIALADALPGMALASALCDAAGSVLLPQGAILSAATLAALQRRDVRQITVQAAEQGTMQAAQCGAASAIPAAPAGAAMESPPASGEPPLQRLQHLFRHSATIEDSGQLMALLERYRSGDAPC